MEARTRQDWVEEETQCFLALWSSREIQDKLFGASRTKPVYEELQREMSAAGYERSVEQLVNKLKKLKKEFRDQKGGLGRRIGARPKNRPHFELLNSVLCDRSTCTAPGGPNTVTVKTETVRTTVTDPELPTVGVEALLPQPASPVPSCSLPLPSHSSPLPSHSSPLPSHSSPLPSHSSPLPSRSSPLPSRSSPLPSHSSPLPSCSSSASSSSRTKSRKRKQVSTTDLLQYMERSQQRFIEQNQTNREVVNAMLQRMNENSAALVGLMGRMVSVLEDLAKKTKLS